MKKGQIKMGETMAILVIFFFLVIIGFSFYTNVQEISYRRQKQLNLDLSIIQLYQRASYMTEFQCTFKETAPDNCYDAHKLKAFEKMIKDYKDTEEFYYRIFGDAYIEIKTIYPSHRTFEIYNHTTIEDPTWVEPVQLPITVYNGSSGKYLFGILNITIYANDI